MLYPHWVHFSLIKEIEWKSVYALKALGLQTCLKSLGKGVAYMLKNNPCRKAMQKYEKGQNHIL